ncbi:hypothetical protein Tco_1114806 [Tanacetum coccineum]
MANLSHVGSLNDDTVELRFDFDIHSEVPHYDTYHDSDMLNSNIQEIGYIENFVSNNESYDELIGNNDVISYTDYMLTIGNDEDNYVGDEAVHKELGDRMERAATTASSLEAEQDSGNINRTQSMATLNGSSP